MRCTRCTRITHTPHTHGECTCVRACVRAYVFACARTTERKRIISFRLISLYEYSSILSSKSLYNVKIVLG